MKKNIIPTLFFALLLITSLPLFAATNEGHTRGTLTVKMLPNSANGDLGVYGTRSVIAVWIQGPTDTTFVKSLTVLAGRRMISLKYWLANSKTKLIAAPVSNIYSFLELDVQTGPTELEHLEIVTEWNGKDPQGAIMPDGVYHVRMEMSQDNQAGKTSSFSFTKGPAGFTYMPVTPDPMFTNLSIVWEPSAVVPDAEAPTKPLKIYSSYVEASSCVLEWSDSQDNVGVLGYNIYNNGVLFSSSPANITSVKLTLTPETTYNFSIKAKDESGNLSVEGPTVQVLTPKDNIAPTAPSGLYLVPSSSKTSTSLRWLGSTDNVGVTSYSVYKNEVLSGTPSTALASTITGLVPGTTYNMKVVAKDANGNTSEAGTFTLLFDITAPVAPTGLKTTSVSSNTIGIAWNATTDNIGVVKYNIYRNGVHVGTTTTATSFELTDLTPLTPYNITVKAGDAAGYLTASLITLTVTTSEPTALNSVEADNRIIIYSVNGKLVTDLSALPGHSVVSVSDMDGQLVKSFKLDGVSSTVNVPAKGIYIVNVMNGGKSFSRKVLVD